MWSILQIINWFHMKNWRNGLLDTWWQMWQHNCSEHQNDVRSLCFRPSPWLLLSLYNASLHLENVIIIAQYQWRLCLRSNIITLLTNKHFAITISFEENPDNLVNLKKQNLSLSIRDDNFSGTRESKILSSDVTIKAKL